MMMMKSRNRNRLCDAGCACCDINLTDIKRYRRRIRRMEKRQWKKEI